MPGSGGSVFAELDRHAAVFVVEDRYEFEAGAECFEVLAQGRDAYIFGVLEFGDSALGDVETSGELDLADRFLVTKLVEADLFEIAGYTG